MSAINVRFRDGPRSRLPIFLSPLGCYERCAPEELATASAVATPHFSAEAGEDCLFDCLLPSRVRGMPANY